MRKHGTNRPSIAAIFATSALLVTSLVGSAFAARTGSSSQSGASVWLVDWAESGCINGTINTSDNFITVDGEWIGLWVKNTSKGLPDAWRLEDKGKFISSGNFWDGSRIWENCGTAYSLLLFAFSNGDVSSNSLTFTALQSGNVFASDTARFD
jgi:hypothetical protein